MELLRILRHAYSAELAAAIAYRGHWRSLPEGADRSRIREIEREEWAHREDVGVMLAALGGRPGVWGEIRAALIGGALAALCHVAGRLAPMYGAGFLESGNVGEYERAALLARTAGREDFVERLLEMAEVEWEHERFFRSRVEAHPWGRRLPIWRSPPPKETIRGSQRLQPVGAER